MAKSTQREMPLTLIRTNPAALRDVERDTEKFHELVESVRLQGIINPIAVREAKDPDTDETYYLIIDGLHRFTGAQEAGLETIPVNIKTANEVEALQIQIMGNLHNFETKPAAYGTALKRLLALDPTLTNFKLASQLGKSVTWVNGILGLTKLTPEIQGLVNDGTFNVTNAQALSKLPEEEQSQYLDRAMGMTPSQFGSLVSNRIKDIKNAKRQGRPTPSTEFVPNPYLQTFATIRDEMDSQQVGKSLIHSEGVTTPDDAWALAIRWVLHMDKASVEIERQKDLVRKKELEDAKKVRAAERAQKKLEEAAKTAALVS